MLPRRFLIFGLSGHNGGLPLLLPGFGFGRLPFLNKEHIGYVLECMNKNTTLIRNIKAYTLAALYNAPATMSQYYASQVSHDMAQGWEDV